MKEKINVVQDSQKTTLSLADFAKSYGKGNSWLSECRAQIDKLKSQVESSIVLGIGPDPIPNISKIKIGYF